MAHFGTVMPGIAGARPPAPAPVLRGPLTGPVSGATVYFTYIIII